MSLLSNYSNYLSKLLSPYFVQLAITNKNLQLRLSYGATRKGFFLQLFLFLSIKIDEIMKRGCKFLGNYVKYNFLQYISPFRCNLR